MRAEKDRSLSQSVVEPVSICSTFGKPDRLSNRKNCQFCSVVHVSSNGWDVGQASGLSQAPENEKGRTASSEARTAANSAI